MKQLVTVLAVAAMTAAGSATAVQTERLYSTLIAQGGAGRIDLRYVEGAGHGGDLFNGETVYARNFLGKSLGVTPVPVPPALPLLGAGLLGLGLLSRRRDRRK